jgi:hypothetical protein
MSSELAVRSELCRVVSWLIVCYPIVSVIFVHSEWFLVEEQLVCEQAVLEYVCARAEFFFVQVFWRE